jgi:hypothetical protein
MMNSTRAAATNITAVIANEVREVKTGGPFRALCGKNPCSISIQATHSRGTGTPACVLGLLPSEIRNLKPTT